MQSLFCNSQRMDVSNPMSSLSPSLDIRTLAVLAGAEASFTSGDVARLVDASRSGVALALDRLVSAGVVDVETHGRTNSYRLNRDHLLADAVLSAANVWESLRARVTEAVERWALPPERVVMFGSAARRDGDGASDIDVLVIPVGDVDPDDVTWRSQVETLEQSVVRWTGNPCEILTMSLERWHEAKRQDAPFAKEVERDGISLLPERSTT